ncbi:MafI family immunity protein [bacterium]|nr:MafI family immunity protein [bacterium]
MNAQQKRCLDLSSTAFESVKNHLSVSDRESVHEYIYSNNEWGLGMETLVSAILETKTSVTLVQKNAIVAAMDVMGLEGSQHEIPVVE